MSLSPQQFIESTLRPGAVYKYEDKEAINTKVPHFFILLNNNPVHEPILLLTCVSSKVQESKRRAIRRGQVLDTLVEFSKESYDFLYQDSIVDCNVKIMKNKEQLIEKCQSGLFEIEKEIDEEKLIELQQAFLKSKKHSKLVKRIIDPNI